MGLGQTEKYTSFLITLAFVFSLFLHLATLVFFNSLMPEEEFRTGRTAFNVSLRQKSAKPAEKKITKVVEKQVRDVLPEKPEPKKVLKKRDILSQSKTIKEQKTTKTEVLDARKQVEPQLEKVKEVLTAEVVNEEIHQETKEELISEPKESVVQTPQYSLGSAQTPRPNYPMIAIKRHWQGRVVLGVTVGVDGRSTFIKILNSSGYAVLDNSAIDTVREQWVFTPGQIAQQAVSAYVTVPISFQF